jgi:hypothetical protein
LGLPKQLRWHYLTFNLLRTVYTAAVAFWAYQNS